ncbi:hypothetical protein [Litorihabitans aurantiacus]|uniref:DUF8094 domain-containing protein n=1 Tax=Litorihabitans aurantiacus TaxID=1930061 RepID=A0AA37USS3_9MICO|nr:hypothetical protein [Litorihabitans aurantiacus]GMA30710.1 hypothetical protein GCM10025875_07020 [Litorihabitans aurantiacus]
MSEIRRRRLALGGALLAAATALTACAPEPAPEMTTPPPPEFAPPAVTEERAQEILAQVEEQIAAADTSGDVEQMRGRVTSPAIDFRQTQYALQTATGGAQTPVPLATDSDIFVVTATDTWPRSILAVSDVVEGSPVRLYLGLVQDAPRDPYRLVAWSRLLPGVQTPTFATAEIGSAPIADDQSELRVTPTDALAQLADVIANPGSEFAAGFGEDPFRLAINAEADGLRQAIGELGEVGSEAVAGEPVFAIATADGGALVMGVVEQAYTLRKTVPDATVTLSPEWSAFVGDEPLDAAARATYRQMVTLSIPPADADTPIQVLGAERVLASVERVE